MWLRISPKSGSTPQMRAFTVFAPTVRPRRRWYSALMRAISGTRARRSAVSSSRKLTGRPAGSPSKGFFVAPGQSTAMPSPMPLVFLWNERFKPSPKDSRSTIERVPQAMASTVRAMRLRCRAASWAKSRRMSPSSAPSVVMRASGRARGRAATPAAPGSSRPRARSRPAGPRSRGSRRARPRACPRTRRGPGAGRPTGCRG